MPVQFAVYLRDIVTGDLGESIDTGQPITEILVQRLPTTVELTIYAIGFAVIGGISLGILAAYRRNSSVDVGTMVGANLGVSIPVFVLGLLLAYVFAIVFKGTFLALPPSGRLTAGTQSVTHRGRVGSRQPRRAAAYLPRLHLEHVHSQRPSDAELQPVL